jgi:hypothetical protein
VRTSSPTPIYRSNKDSRNNALWQPSDGSLRNLEVDEAGKLAAFRARFGRGWDVESTAAPIPGSDAASTQGSEPAAVAAKASQSSPPPETASVEDSLADLISQYATISEGPKGGVTAGQLAKAEKERLMAEKLAKKKK